MSFKRGDRFRLKSTSSEWDGLKGTFLRKERDFCVCHIDNPPAKSGYSPSDELLFSEFKLIPIVKTGFGAFLKKHNL